MCHQFQSGEHKNYSATTLSINIRENIIKTMKNEESAIKTFDTIDYNNCIHKMQKLFFS